MLTHRRGAFRDFHPNQIAFTPVSGSMWQSLALLEHNKTTSRPIVDHLKTTCRPLVDHYFSSAIENIRGATCVSDANYFAINVDDVGKLIGFNWTGLAAKMGDVFV